MNMDDKMLYVRLAGALLTVRQFSEAKSGYVAALNHGATEKSIAYYIGVWHYLQGEYAAADEWFKRYLPCGDEMTIAVIYWHTLCCARIGKEAELLTMIRDDMKVGHHTAYLTAMRVFDKTVDPETAITALEDEKSDLNFVVTAYGLCVYFEKTGDHARVELIRTRLLEKEGVWPCISYLAAWNDAVTRR